MKSRSLITLLTLFGLALGLVAYLSFGDPDPAEAICFCPSYGWSEATPVRWGKGDNCTEAEDDLRTQTLALAYADCGDPFETCVGTLVKTANPECYWNGSEYVVDGYLRYECRPTDCGPPVP